MSRFLTKSICHQFTKRSAAAARRKVENGVFKTLTVEELSELGSRAIKLFVGYPYRCRLPGMTRDLSEHDKRLLAHFEASVVVLGRLGGLDRERLNRVFPRLNTEVQDVIDDGVVRYEMTKQK